jgi:hypothetical protein
MLACDIGVLQEISAQQPELANSAALGAARTDESCATSEVR